MGRKLGLAPGDPMRAVGWLWLWGFPRACGRPPSQAVGRKVGGHVHTRSICVSVENAVLTPPATRHEALRMHKRRDSSPTQRLGQKPEVLQGWAPTEGPGGGSSSLFRRLGPQACWRPHPPSVGHGLHVAL